jgi:hypothetical protein
VSQINVRGIPEDVVQLLREEAVRRHRSLNMTVVAALEEYARELRHRTAVRGLLPRLERFQQAVLERRGGVITDDSVELIRADRER